MTLRLPDRGRKPRERGLTSVIDFGPDEYGWTGEHGLADLLSCAGEYIDYAKIYALNALLMPEAALKRIVSAYREADVRVFAGGILFEYCYLNNEVEALPGYLSNLGIKGLEISENYIRLDAEERAKHLDFFHSRGFSVIYEFGRKNPEEPMRMEHLQAIVSEMLQHGVTHVTVEQSEMDFLATRDLSVSEKLKAQPWFKHIFIEADPYRFPNQHAELLKDFGTDVNLANIAAGQALRLEGLRRGIGRATDYSLIRNLVSDND